MTRLPAPFFVLVVYISGSMLAGEPVSCAQQNTSGVADSSSLASPQGVAAEGGYQELPPPGTTAAQALVADPRTSGSVRDTYTLSQDSTQITEDCTSAFLAQLQANPQTAAACNIADVTTFSKVPKDLLNYLRYHRSTVLLPLLRQFCSSGAGQLKLQGVNQKQLKSEISALLNTSALDQYYRTTSNREGTAGVSGRSGSTNVTAKPTRQASKQQQMKTPK